MPAYTPQLWTGEGGWMSRTKIDQECKQIYRKIHEKTATAEDEARLKQLSEILHNSLNGKLPPSHRRLLPNFPVA